MKNSSCKFIAPFVESSTARKVSGFTTTRLWLLLISLLFANFAYSDQSNIDNKIPIEHKLLVVGDSLSAAYGLTAQQGWVYLLAKQWQTNNQSIEVVNAAISGDTTDGGLARLPRLLDLHKPTHLYIELGGNNALQGHNPRKIEQNLFNMIELAQANNVEVIIQEVQIPTNYGSRYTKAFNKIFHELADKFDLSLIPFFLEEIALDPKLMQRDGIHPTGEAQPLIVDFMSPKLLVAIKS